MMKETFLSEKQDHILEKAFAYAMMNHGNYLIKANQIQDILSSVKPYMLTDSTAKMIYISIAAVVKEGLDIDIISVSQKAKEKHGKQFEGENIVSLVSTFSANFVSVGQINSICNNLIKLYFQRKGIELGIDGVMKILQEDADPLILFKNISQKFIDFDLKINPSQGKSRVDSHVEEMNEDVRKIRSGEMQPYLSTSFAQVDQLHNGFTNTDLIIIAARPGMGKTALVISMAKNIALKNDPVAVFSLEMRAKHITGRIAASIANINAQLIRDPRKMSDLEYTKFLTASAKISKAPLFIEENVRYISAIESKSRQLVINEGVKLIVIDYLQLIQIDGRFGNREQEVSQISRRLKELASELDVPVVALAQLSRALETRGGEKIPHLSDLRESGSIEQDADIVSFIYRPEYYNIYEDNNGKSLVGSMAYIVAKNRHGPLNRIYLHFNKYTTNVVANEEVKQIETHRPDEADDSPF